MIALKKLQKYKSIFVTGTDTEVGKTYVSSILAKTYVDKGINTAVFKPLASGSRKDAEILKEAARIQEPIEKVNPIFLKKPLAPYVAARYENKTFSWDNIDNVFHYFADKYDKVIVEGVWGVLVPIFSSWLAIDIPKRWNIPVLIVARPGLGTINHTLLTVEALRNRSIDIIGIVINYSQKEEESLAHKTNPEIIEAFTGSKCLGVIRYGEVNASN